MARPYGGGDEGRWRERGGGEDRFGPRRHDWPGSERSPAAQTERRYGGAEGGQGEYGGELGSRDPYGWEERPGYGEPRRYGGGRVERDEGRWYGDEWERDREGGRERARAGEYGAREGYRAAGSDAVERSGATWPGGVRGAEAGQPYGRGFFGTAYALYAGGGTERGRVGRGPKGYRRSDERIHDEVCERIARAGVDADEVEVKVANGEVTLSGSVHRREEKRWLEDLAEDVYGVQQVHNHLRVARQ